MAHSADRQSQNAIDLLHDLIGRARRTGADAADAVLFEGTSLSHGRRLGKTEKLERSEGQDLGLRVFIGRQQAIVSSSDRSPRALGELVERAVAMAKTVPEDPYCGIAEPEEIARNWPALDMFDAARAQRRGIDRTGARRRGGGPSGRRRDQFRGRRGRLGPLRDGASRFERVRRDVSGVRATGSAPRSSAAPAPAWSATTIIPAQSMPRICATRPKSARPPANARSNGLAPGRCRPAAARWCSIRGSRAASSRICWARSRARRSPAAPAF